ncbi:alpha/beta fold hydrolase [Glutamicibacter sp. X7]
MSKTEASGIDRFAQTSQGTRICYRDMGESSSPALLLLAGLGEDLTFWTDDFFDALVDRGFRVIAIDNRDVGRSSFVQQPAPPVWRQLAGLPRPDAYTLKDMAQDALGVLNHLGLERVHLVGRSMGGMIAQIIAATEPQRVLSLCSLYSSTGAKGVGGQALSTLGILAAQAAQNRTQAVIDHLRITRHVAGTAHPLDEVAEAAIAATGWDRCAGNQAAGVARQIQAIKATGDRSAQLRRITAPTLVINGDRDLMIDPSGGRATAAAIHGARHIVIPGMGHHVPQTLIATLVEHIAEHAGRVVQGGSHVAQV